MKKSPGENRLLALAFLKRHGPSTASRVGDYLWNGRGTLVDGRPCRKPQAFARSAGIMLKKLEKDGLVQHYFDDYHCMWRIAKLTSENQLAKKGRI